jgi:alpha-tubulin suppressor-like RCC1 family protein
MNIKKMRGGAVGVCCALALAFGSSGCGGEGGAEPPEADGPTSTVEVALTTVPASAQCIRITATPASGSSTVRTFTVTAGSSSASLSVGKLSPNSYTLSGDAFNVACTSIGSSVGDWVADPVSVTMKAGVTSSVVLTFRKNNPLTASANFVNNVLGVSLQGGTSFVFTDGGLLESGTLSNTKTFTRINFSAFDATTVPGNAVTHVAPTAYGACAARVDGTVWCWGQNAFGELGAVVGTAASPVQIPGLSAVTQLASGNFHACAIGNYGVVVKGVLCWGINSQGSLGNGTGNNSSTPVVALSGAGFNAAPKYIACGELSSHAVLADGSLRAWGWNGFGQLGDGTTTDRFVPVVVSGESAVETVAAGSAHTCSVRADGGVRCWGYNSHGELGNGTTTNSSVPVLVGGLSARQVSAGNEHTCALATTGQTMCWGSNARGELGNGTITNRTSPGAVALTGGVTLALLWSGHAFHTCGITSNSDLYCWGHNAYGQLGDGTINTAFLPIRPRLQ